MDFFFGRSPEESAQTPIASGEIKMEIVHIISNRWIQVVMNKIRKAKNFINRFIPLKAD